MQVETEMRVVLVARKGGGRPQEKTVKVTSIVARRQLRLSPQSGGSRSRGKVHY